MSTLLFLFILTCIHRDYTGFTILFPIAQPLGKKYSVRKDWARKKSHFFQINKYILCSGTPRFLQQCPVCSLHPSTVTTVCGHSLCKMCAGKMRGNQIIFTTWKHYFRVAIPMRKNYLLILTFTPFRIRSLLLDRLPNLSDGMAKHRHRSVGVYGSQGYGNRGYGS